MAGVVACTQPCANVSFIAQPPPSVTPLGDLYGDCSRRFVIFCTRGGGHTHCSVPPSPWIKLGVAARVCGELGWLFKGLPRGWAGCFITVFEMLTHISNFSLSQLSRSLGFPLYLANSSILRLLLSCLNVCFISAQKRVSIVLYSQKHFFDIN